MAAATSIILAGVAVAGATATAVGQAKAAKAKEEQARQNAAFLGEQAANADYIKERNLENFQEHFTELMGKQRGVFARAGIKLSGTAKRVQEVAQIRANKQEFDILKEGNFNVRLAMLRSQASTQQANGIAAAAPWQIGGSLLSSAGNIYGTYGVGGGGSPPGGGRKPAGL